jgi:hypothetical protein
MGAEGGVLMSAPRSLPLERNLEQLPLSNTLNKTDPELIARLE